MNRINRRHSLNPARKTIGGTFDLHQSKKITTMHSTLNTTIDVQQQISNKYKTFAKWNYRQSLSKKKKSENRQIADTKTNSNNMMNALMNYMNHLKEKEEKKKPTKKKELKVQELQGIKDERRERLKKIQNPVHLIQHYISKQGYSPTQEENILLDKIIKLKDLIINVQPMNLEIILTKLYKIMNVAVDLNQMKFFIGIILLTADISYYFKEYIRAVHFYTQATVAATCTNMFNIKTESFIKIGLICTDINEYEKATLFYKKALQYAWKSKDKQNELRIYDYLGQSYYYQGKISLATYYHNRAVQGQFESTGSAIKRISVEMLNEFDKYISNSQKQNLSKLFIEYLDLPITNFFQVKPIQLQKVYQNYIKDESPRKQRRHKDFQFEHFYSVEMQLEKLLTNCSEFQTELPNPDIHQNFVATHRFGKPKKEIEFEQSNQFHKLKGPGKITIDKSILKLPLDQQIDQALDDKQNPYWWQQILIKIKKEKQQKIGSLRNRVWNTHKSNQKYPQERKRASSLKSGKISESINNTILNLIDPIKNS